MSNYNQTLQTNNSSLEDIITKINELPDAGSAKPVLQDKTVTPTTSQQTVVADGDYDGLGTVTVNAMSTATQATPIVSIDSNGKITATATQVAGYVVAGTQTSTKQLAFQAAKTITPTTVDQIAVSSAYYTGGNITVKGDSNLIANNIKNGVSIFGVTGNYEGNGGAGSGSDTSSEDGLVTRTVSTYINDRVTTIGNYAFYSCSKLASISFPNATTIGSYAFYRCSTLRNISFPNLTTIVAYAFGYCSKLTNISFPNATTIGSYAFQHCKALRVIYLTKSNLCGLSNSNAFYNTDITSTTGSIFVPTSLVASYKKATNWVFFSNRIFGI